MIRVARLRDWVVHRWWAFTALALMVVFVLSVSQHFLLVTGTVLCSLIAIVAGMFAALYGWRSAWKSTPAGRALMYTMISLSLFATQVSAGAWTTLILHYETGYPWRLEIRVIIYAVLTVTVTRMIANLVQIQRQP